jgi:SAM-dependent methyltransferase
MTWNTKEINEKQLTCFICGSSADFINQKDVTQRESLCTHCGSSRRNSDLASIILETFLPGSKASLRLSATKLSPFSIFEAQAKGHVHNCLKDLPHYICSEYFDDIPKGNRNAEGILCENLEDLSFPDERFDLVITQDVLEHVAYPEKAFSEIYRVLKYGGYHIFTIPYHESQPTLCRVVVKNGEKTFRYPPVYHGDPLREQGALVFTDFGSDMNKMIEDTGFRFEIIPCKRWYSVSEIPYITDEKEYQRYLRYTSEGKMLEYFKYNSWVFRARKE